ncbi:hypothetical protein [Ideonella sp.]|uniref:hypothetical protein n=1 Tax=Ideonella sp. TaxID=1929293 RepID=UPI0035B4949A
MKAVFGWMAAARAARLPMRACRLVMLAAVPLALGACAAFDGYPQRVTDPEADLKKLEAVIDVEAMKTCLKTPSEACRSELVSARMYAIDIRFSQFEETLFRDTRKAGFSATLATLGLNSAAAVSSGGAAQVLSGLSAFIIGGREAYDKEVLAERTLIAIHTGMRARRAEVAFRLRAGLGQSLVEYPVGMALSDLNEYYNAGTVLGALVGITEAVGAKAEKAEAKLTEQFSFQKDEAGDAFFMAVCAGDPKCPTPNMGVFDKVKQDCFKPAGVAPGTLFTDLVLSPEFARERARVAVCMKWLKPKTP